MTTPAIGTAKEEVVILAPTGQDAQLVAAAIAERKTRARIVANVDQLCERMLAGGVAAIIVAEEAFAYDSLDQLNLALESQEPWSDTPVILMTSSGETTLAIVRFKKAFSPSGNLTLLERPFRRITLLSAIEVALRARRKQHEVRKLLEQQSAATRLRDEFISIASHELKTPLTSLKLQTQLHQLLVAKGDPTAFASARVNKLIESTNRQIDRLARLVEELLDVSRITAGKLQLHKESFDLSQLVYDTIERTHPQLQEAGINVDLLAEPGVTGEWDRYRLEQVLNNLLSNAVRYCAGRPLHMEVTRAAQSAVLTVRDEGPGIAPENLERVFERFERAVHPNHISGLGLGLYICREIVEAHAGTIHVSSELGAGSCFTVELPRDAAGLSGTADGALRSAAAGGL